MPIFSRAAPEMPPAPAPAPLNGAPGLPPGAADSGRAALAVGLVPPMVLLALLAVVAGWIEPGTGLVLFSAGLAWLAFELRRYLRRVDAELESVVEYSPWR